MKPALVFIGLGNHGKNYARTRHNIGFLAADTLAKECADDEFADKQKFLSSICEGTIGETPILIVKPQTFMNRSGEAVKKIVDFYHLDAKTQVIVSCDEVDLPLGTFRMSLKGSGGTHNGLKSVVEVLGEDFPRLRIGIGPKPEAEDLATWVLSRMKKNEEDELAHVLSEVPSIVRSHIETTA